MQESFVFQNLVCAATSFHPHIHYDIVVYIQILQARLTESQYQLAPWRSEALNSSVLAPQSPSHSFGVALTKV